MINETDIQIGDWLHLEYTNSIQGFVSFNFRVSQLRRDYGDELLVWGEKTPDGKHFGNMGGVSKIQPIPLTPEILEKNGMKPFEVDRLRDKHSSAKWWSKGGDFFVKQYNFKHNDYEPTYSVGGNYHSLIIGLKYVHELQHALRLCGIEYEITI